MSVTIEDMTKGNVALSPSKKQTPSMNQQVAQALPQVTITPEEEEAKRQEEIGADRLANQGKVPEGIAPKVQTGDAPAAEDVLQDYENEVRGTPPVARPANPVASRVVYSPTERTMRGGEERPGARQDTTGDTSRGYLIPTYGERFKQLKQNFPDIESRVTPEWQAEVKKIKRDVGQSYLALLKLDDPEKNAARLAALEESTHAMIPKLDSNGEVVLDANGVPVPLAGTAKYSIGGGSSNIDARVIRLIENAVVPNGIYLLYRDGETNIPAYSLDIKTELDQLTGDIQGSFTSFFAREESKKGGGGFYNDVLMAAGVTDPMKRLFYLRQQTKSGFGGPIGTSVESFRAQQGLKYSVPLMASFLWQIPSYVADKTVSAVSSMYQFALPYDLQGGFSILQNSETGEGPQFGGARRGPTADLIHEAMKNAMFGPALRGELPNLIDVEKTLGGYAAFWDLASRWGKEAGVSTAEAAAVLDYTPDALTFATRIIPEMTYNFPAVLKGMQKLDQNMFRNLGEFMRERYGDIIKQGWDEVGGAYARFSDGNLLRTPVTALDELNLSEISRMLEKNNVSFHDVMDDFVSQQAGVTRAWVEASLGRGIAEKLRYVSPQRAEFFAPNVNLLDKKLEEVTKKITEAMASPPTNMTKLAKQQQKKRVATLRNLKNELWKQKNQLVNREIIPPFARDFFTDEAIATAVGASAYTLLYRATATEEGFDTTVPGIGSFVAALASMHPKVRRGASHSAEGIKYAFQSVLNKASFGIVPPRPPPEAVMLARRLKSANPELRERIYSYMASISDAVVKYGGIKYPPTHPTKAGQVIMTEDVLYNSFAKMSGLSTLNAMQEQASTRTGNVNDLGKLGRELKEIQTLFDQKARMSNELGEIVQNLKYLDYDDMFDPDSEAGNFVRTLTKFYADQVDSLARDRAEFKTLTDGSALESDSVSKIFAIDADPTDVEAFIEGGHSIAVALSQEMQRFQKYNIDPNLPDIQKEKVLQARLQEVQKNIADAFERHREHKFSNNRHRSNSAFVEFIKANEVVAYTEASNKFKALKLKYPDDAKVDLTDIHDQIVLGEIELDFDVVDQVAPILSEGTEASRGFIPANVSSSTFNSLKRLFGESADDYMDAFYNNSSPELLDSAEGIFKALEIEDASSYVKMLALRDGLKKVGADVDTLPKIGVNVTQLMQIVSGLGRKVSMTPNQVAMPINQLRDSILDRGKAEFYGDFYGKNRVNLGATMGDEYEVVRTFYKERYINPFRNENTSIKKIIKSGDSFGDLDVESLDRFVKSFKLNRSRTTADLATMQEQLARVIGREDENGALLGIDVTTPEGSQVQSIFTALVIEELSSTLGGKKLRKLLATKADENAIVKAGSSKAIGEFVEGLKAGDMTGESSINLSNFYSRTPEGLYLLRDVNGQPLIDMQAVDSFLGFDNIKRVSKDAQEAEKVFFADLEKSRAEWRIKFGAKSGRLSGEIELRRGLLKSLGNVKGGIGRGILDKLDTNDGPTEIAKITDDYVKFRTIDTPPTERVAVAKQARAEITQVMQQSVIDALYEDITKLGENVTYDVTINGNRSVETKRGTDIDPPKLLKLIGYRGDLSEASKKSKEIRKLLGDEVYEHLEFVGKTLYVDESTASKMNITGWVRPLSAESYLSRVTSFFRGVISLRWLISEAAIRESRRANTDLTKMMLFDPTVGRKVLDMVMSDKFSPERFAEVYPVLITTIAKNDVLMQMSTDDNADTPRYPNDPKNKSTVPAPNSTNYQPDPFDASP